MRMILSFGMVLSSCCVVFLVLRPCRAYGIYSVTSLGCVCSAGEVMLSCCRILRSMLLIGMLLVRSCC